MRYTVACAGAALFGGALYVIGLQNPFVYDDFRTIVDNGSMRSLSSLRSLLMFDITRPLTNFSFALDYAVWGPEPFGFHLTNLLLHVLNVALVFVVASAVWSDTRQGEVRAGATSHVTVAAITALLFAAHPMMSEAVGYVSSRSDLLCTAFFLVAFLAGRTWIGGGRAWSGVLAWLAWSAALLSKETAAFLPVVLLLSMTLLPAARPRSPRWTRLGALILVMFLAGLIRVAVFSSLEGATVVGGWQVVPSALVAFWHYVLLLCAAAGQSIYHAPHLVQSTADTAFWTGAVLSVIALMLAWRFRQRAPAAVFGAAWFVVLLAPLTVLGAIDGASAVAEHRAYLPSVGFFLMIAAVGGYAAPVVGRYRSTRLLAPLAVAAVVLMLGGRTVLRTLVWGDAVSLWDEAVRSAPGEWLPRAVLGESLHAAGRHEEAVASYRQSLTLAPRTANTFVNLVVCLSELGRDDEARSAIDRFEALEPTSPFVPIARGSVAAIGGRPQEAKPEFLRALERDPASVMARQWLAVLAEENGDPAEALNQCYELQRLAPGRLSIDECIARARAGASVFR